MRLELVTAVPCEGQTYADLAEPFVTLGGHGQFSRTLLARVGGPSGETIREVALKVQSDEYPVAELPGWSNCDVDEQWREQWRVWTIAAAAGAAPQVVDVLPRAADGGAPLLPPTLYCKQRRAFFVAPCPECAAPLETCRENRLLEEQGLPRYDQSLERFLYCSGCHTAGRRLQFYALILSEPRLRGSAPVGEQTDLYQALGRLARGGGPLPCFGCERVPSCYPPNNAAAGDATRFLTPLSFYDYRCLPLDRLHLHYDKFAALLGGQRAHERVAGRLEAPLGAHVRQYFFEDDPRGKLALEVLHLKLRLFGQLVAAVSSLHRATRLPHLGLSPENIMVEWNTVPAGLPSLYNFRTKLLGIGNASPCRLRGRETEDLASPLLVPAPLRDATYASPLFASASRPVHGGFLTIAGISAVGSERVILETDMTSDSFDLRTLRTKDTLQVTVRQGRPLPLSIEFLANPMQLGATRVRLRSVPVAMEATLTSQLRGLLGQAPIRATFAVFPCLHVPCDLQSLGLLLFTTLAANAEQGPAVVATVARELSEHVARFAREHAGAGADEVGHFARRELRVAEADGVLARRHLFHCPPDHADPLDQVPDVFWHGALLLGLRALTQASGFGFCREHDDFDLEHPEGPADHLRAELDVLGHNIDAELLGMNGKHREVAVAVARVRAEMISHRPEETP